MDRFADGIAWIRSTGVDVNDAQPVLEFGRGHQFDTDHYLDTCRRIVVEAGGEILTATDTERLRLENGAVTGAELATGPDGAGFYGHLIPSGIPFADPSDFARGRLGHRWAVAPRLRRRHRIGPRVRTARHR